MSSHSYRTILRSSSIIGSAQIVNILARLAKIKFVALVLGPAGVGLAGLFFSLIETVSTLAALGIQTAGTRRIAAAKGADDEEAVAKARRAIMVGGALLALVGAMAFWFAGEWIERFILDGHAIEGAVPVLALGVALMVLVAAQTAVLSGLRRIGDLARINVASAIISALVGVIAVWQLGIAGVVLMVVSVPAVTFLCGILALVRIGSGKADRLELSNIRSEWKAMIGIGLAFMVSALVVAAGQLVARTLVQDELGVAALGYFQAAWAIAMTYLGFVLAAMATDYFPRLSAIITDREAATKLVNEQTDVALLLCGPLLLAGIGLAPWIIEFLYSSQFGPSVDLLRWQLTGDILKVMSWPLGFVLLAAGAGKTYVATQSIGMGVFLLGLHFGMPEYGLEAAGVAFVALYAVLLPVNAVLARRLIGFEWLPAVKRQGVAVLVAAAFVLFVGRWSNSYGAISGLVLAVLFGFHSLARLRSQAFEVASGARAARLGERIIGWISHR